MTGPRVSIGAPIWNSARHMRKGLDSLLGQTFADFELIICDNASTDGTSEISESYAARDPRVRYERNPVNIGLQGNFQRVLDLATAPYFMWGCPDDLWDRTYLERMVDVLDTQPGVVVAGSNAGWIDQDGILRGGFDNVGAYPSGTTIARARRFIAIPPGRGHATLIYGLMRRPVIQRLGYGPRGRIYDHNRGYFATDVLTLFRLLFEGEFHVVGETLYFHRDPVWYPPAVRLRRLFDGRARWRVQNVVRGTAQFHRYYGDLRDIIRESDLESAVQGPLLRAIQREELHALPRYVRAAVRPTATVRAGPPR